MNSAPKIDVRDLASVREAAKQTGGVVLGDDWIVLDPDEEAPIRRKKKRGVMFILRRSAIARKIMTFQILALIILVAGVLYLSPARSNLTAQRAEAMATQARLIADVFAASVRRNADLTDISGEGARGSRILAGIEGAQRSSVFIFDEDGGLVARQIREPVPVLTGNETLITGFVNRVWDFVINMTTPAEPMPVSVELERARLLVGDALGGQTRSDSLVDFNGQTVIAASAPIIQNGRIIGAVAMTSAGGEIDSYVRREREQVLQMFIVGLVVSIGLSLVLASTIANPISELAAAADVANDKEGRRFSPGRVRIPDLSARPDEIGRLSRNLKGMVDALYERIDANEQFAADVAHEIKNPLASLRSAVGTMSFAKKEEQRAKLLEVIEHDVNRLDRLVSDISNASRLDSELVKEEEEPFDLLKMLNRINVFQGQQAAEKGVDFLTDMPESALEILGLENRLAQVFVNIISNAISFCEEGDAIRVWVRQRQNRVLVVIEDTGPGIPDEALGKIFSRFYSERPESQFGNNSGLGLAISKQIVEAHGGVIWAENIRPTDADITSEPLGARFVVGLPV